MRILIIGGSGLLGSHTVREALERGHSVTILSRGKLALQQDLERGVEQVRGDISSMSRPELAVMMTESEAVIYALGIDDRELRRRPAYREFHHDHVTVCMNVLQAARDSGVKKFVVFGSYFTYFDKAFPDRNLARKHVYIRTRCEQRDAVLSAARSGFDTFVLELPYILGSLPGSVPPWTFLFSMLAARGRNAYFFLSGGTAAVTARQVGQAALGAIERGSGSGAYPIGGCNLKWTDFARKFFAVTGSEKKLVGIPRSFFRVFGFLNATANFLRGKEQGLSIGAFTDLQYGESFIDPVIAMEQLGYRHDDYDSALADVIAEWRTLNRRP